MSYRDDLEAAHQRIHTLEQEKAALLSKDRPVEPSPKVERIQILKKERDIILYWMIMAFAGAVFHGGLVAFRRLDPSTSTRNQFFAAWWAACLLIRAVIHYMTKKEDPTS